MENLVCGQSEELFLHYLFLQSDFLHRLDMYSYMLNHYGIYQSV